MGRSLEHSTIIYETPDLTSLLRLAWNKQDPNYLATMMTDSSKAIILDIRYAHSPLLLFIRAQRRTSITLNCIVCKLLFLSS